MPELTTISGAHHAAPHALDGVVGYALRRAQLLTMGDLAAALHAIGLRPVTFSILAVIGATPGQSQSGVCESLGIQRTNFVALVVELEVAGLLSRTPSPTDRRQNLLALTEAGTAALRQAWTCVEAEEQRIEAILGVQGKRQLQLLLSRLNAATNHPPAAAGQTRRAAARAWASNDEDLK